MNVKKPTVNKFMGYPLTIFFCSLIGALAFLIIYGVNPLNPYYDAWIMHGYGGEGDIVQEYAGWLFFRESPWSWPPAMAANMAYPYGYSTLYSNSSPIVPIILKLFTSHLSQPFQYLGLYIFLCFILQGISSGMLLSLFTKERRYILLGVILFVFSPIMLERAFRHSSLASHYLIIFALYLFFKSRQDNFRSISPLYAVLTFLGMGIHPYFCPMTLGIFAANVLGYIIRYKKIFTPLILFFQNIIALLSCAYLMGAFTVSSNSRGGFGFYSMNLNAPFNPTSTIGPVWSRIFPTRPQIFGNYDGFNYLGAGVLLALFILGIAYVVNRSVKKFNNVTPGEEKKGGGYVEIIFMSVCFTLFALSCIITFDNIKVLDFKNEMPNFLFEIASVYRASSRMFYPVFYLIYLFVFLSIIRYVPYKKIGYALTALLVVQLFDLSQVIYIKNQDFSIRKEAIGYFADEHLKEFPRLYHTAYLLDFRFDYDLALFLARGKIKSNIYFFNTGDSAPIVKDYEKYINHLKSNEPANPNIVYFVSSPELLEKLEKEIDLSKYNIRKYSENTINIRSYEWLKFLASIEPKKGAGILIP